MSIINYHPVPLRKDRGHRASLCLGERPSLCKCLDLRYSFESMVNAEYGGRNHLHIAAQNYVTNVKKEEPGISGITYEKALRNLIVTMYGHYVNLLRCHSATAGHRCLIAYNCLEVAAKLGRYHCAVRRLELGKTLPDWLTVPEIPADDPRKELMDTFTQLGDPMHPVYGHPKILARGFDHIYHEAREMGQLPLRSGKSPEVSHMVYCDEYAQVVNRLSTLSQVNDKRWVRPVPCSLAQPEIIYPGKMYEAYCLKVPKDGHLLEREPTSTFTMDGLWPCIDVRPEVKIPKPPRDQVDEDPQVQHLSRVCRRGRLDSRSYSSSSPFPRIPRKHLQGPEFRHGGGPYHASRDAYHCSGICRGLYAEDCCRGCPKGRASAIAGSRISRRDGKGNTALNSAGESSTGEGRAEEIRRLGTTTPVLGVCLSGLGGVPGMSLGCYLSR